MRAHNMCYSTLVLDDAYAWLDGTEYYEVDTAMGTYRFAQDPPGVLPALLDDLAKFRKAAKKDMARAKADGDAWTEALANGRQLAYKITMNSVYGFAGATKGMLPCVSWAGLCITLYLLQLACSGIASRQVDSAPWTPWLT